MQLFEILQSLENNSGKLIRQQILNANNTSEELQQILDAAFNYRRRFHMKKWASTPATTPTATHAEFISLLNELEARRITGHAAVNATEAFFNRCSPEQVKWYTRTIQQDLKMGVSVDTAIKCGFDIPTFEVQLAQDGKKCKKLPQLLGAGCYASRKLDGYRCVAIISDGEVVLFSRNGIAYENFPIIAEQLLKAYPTERLILDGEIMSDDFNSMQQTAFASKRGTSVGDVVYHVFDQIPYDEWFADNFVTPHAERIVSLDAILEPLDPKYFHRVEHTLINSLEQVQQLERQYIEDGFEGVMINPNLPYYRGRKSNSMLKFKTMLSMDCEVIDFYEGEVDTRHRGSLGGFVVRQENGEICKVGSGFKDEERAWIWNNKNQVLGSIVEVKYQELTPDKKMRFPTKFRYRNDQSPADFDKKESK